MVAVVRRGEKYNPLVGNVNFEKNNLLQFIDLELMSRIFMFSNPAYTRQAYLERIVDTLEETDQPVYPIPATKSSLSRTNESVSTYKNIATKSTIAGAAGLILMAPLLFL